MELKKTKRRSGTSGELGVIYEKKLLVLGLYRAIKAKYEFTLDTNIEGVGAFDDVVFTYKGKDGIEQRIYLQAKHKEAKNKKIQYNDLMKSGNDDYALYKYFIDYIETVRNFDEKGEIRSKYFIIYTNIGFHRQDKGTGSKGKDDKEIRIQNAISKDDYFVFRKLDLSSHRPLEVFSTVDSFYQFSDWNKNDEDEKTRVINVLKSTFKKIDENKKDPKFAKMSEHELESKLKDYLNKLVFAVDQHDEKNLGDEIKKEVKQSLKSMSQDHVDFIFEYALNEIGQWKGRSKAIPLTKKDNYFEKGEKKFKKFPALYPTLVYENELGSSNIRFKKGNCEVLSDFISSEKKIGFISTETPRLNGLFLYQALNEETLRNEKGINYANREHHFFLTWSDLLKGSAQFIFPAFKGMLQSLLIIVHESTDTVNLKTAEIVSDMENIVSVSNNKFIVIAPENCELSTELKKRNIVDYNIILNIEFGDLTTESQEACLTTKKIRFRGKDELLSIQELLGREETSKPNLNTSELEMLLKNTVVKIGKVPHTLSDLHAAYYHTRVHIGYDKLIHVLKQNPADIFVFTGEENEIKTLLPSDVQKELISFEDGIMPSIKGFILLKPGQEDKQFKQLCHQVNEIQSIFSNPTLHLLRNMNNGWKWIRTYSPDFYMDRHFYPLIVDKIKLTEVLLDYCDSEEIADDFFILSGTDEESLYETLNINELKDLIRKNVAVFLDEESAKEKFEVCKRLFQDEVSIHWLKVIAIEDHIHLLWYCSEGILDNIRRLLVDEEVEKTPINEATFAKSTERVIILADEPGMGKTMTLTHIGEMIQKENPYSWVMRIDLNRHQAVLASKRMKTLEDLVDLLLSFDEKLHNPLMHHIFINKLTCPGQAVLLWDGFDEVKSDGQNSILKLLRFLQLKTTATIWVTTRRHDQKKLEDKLSVLAHPFVPLKESEQIDFLSRFWATTLKLTSQIPDISILKCYAGKVIEAFERSIQTHEGDNFISIPLRARMLGEVYQEKVEKALINQESLPEFLNGNEKLNIGNLYKQFICRKYDLYLWDKANVGEGLDEDSKTSLMRRYSKAYGILAIKVLFDQLFINLKNTEYSLNTLSRIGLIQENEEPVNFIHRTFAEYFAGKLLANQVKDSKIKTFVNAQLYKKKFEITRRFFDYFLTQDLQLHRAVLNGDLSALQKSLESQHSSVIEKTDDLGRTTLHLAAQEGRCDMIPFLQNLQRAEMIRDETGKTPLHYAAVFGHDAVINELLENYIATFMDELVFRTPLNFVEAIGNILFDNLRYARRKFVKLVNEQDEAGKTALNYAVDNEYWFIAVNLLLYSADDSVLMLEQRRRILSCAQNKWRSFILGEEIGKIRKEFNKSFINDDLTERVRPQVASLLDIQFNELLPQICLAISIKDSELTRVFDALLRIIMNKRRRSVMSHVLSSHTSFSLINSTDEYFFTDTEYSKIVRYFFEQLTKHGREIELEEVMEFLSIAADHGFSEMSKYLYEFGVNKKTVFRKLRNLINKRNAAEDNRKITLIFFHHIKDLKKENTWLQKLISISSEKFGWTRLHLAAMNKNVKSFDDFLNPFVIENVKCKDIFGNTPLHYAAQIPEEKSEFIESLFEALRAQNSNDRNQLYEIVNAKNNEGNAPLYYVIEAGNLDSAEVFLKIIEDIGFNQEQLFNILYNRDSNDIFKILLYRDRELIELLFLYIRSFNFSSQQCMEILKRSNETLCDIAVRYVDKFATVISCIENLPLDNNQRSEIFSGTLHLFAETGFYYDIIQSLLKIGAIFDAYDSYQQTPLDAFISRFGRNLSHVNYSKTHLYLRSITRLFELIVDEEITQVKEKLDEFKETLNRLKDEPWIDPETILNARNRERKTLLDLSKYEEVTNLLRGLRQHPLERRKPPDGVPVVPRTRNFLPFLQICRPGFPFQIAYVENED